MRSFLDRDWYGASVTQWLIAAALFVGVYAVLALLRRVLVRRLGMLAARTTTDWDDLAVQLVDRTRWYFLLLVAAFAATRVIPVSGDLARVFRALAVLLVLLQTGVWGNGIIGFTADHYVRQRAAADAGTRGTIRAIGYAGRFVLWSLLIITALQNFGINVTALVTGLGIGGIAIALAVQNILGDLFAALAIVLDKPFVVGDSIQVDTLNGTIEHVGLKTTRIRSINGEQIVIANSELLKSRIRNFKRMEQRRATFNLDLAFDTPPDKLAAIPAMVRQVVESQPNVQFDRSHLLSISDVGPRIETAYVVLDPDYHKYADIQQAIYLELLRRLDREKIQLGFPLRSLTLRSS
ncbi:MAG: mechanosensitive ion channel family protein [Gemmatimonadaceae bacterium]